LRGDPLDAPRSPHLFARKSILNHSDVVSDERRVVVVTGAGGSGCGRAIAARFASAGALAVVSDINEAGGHDTVSLIAGRGGRAAFCRTDMRKESEVCDLISFAESTFGGVTVLVNNASAPHGGEGIEDWMEAIETDLLGTIYATRWGDRGHAARGRWGHREHRIDLSTVARPKHTGRVSRV